MRYLKLSIVSVCFGFCLSLAPTPAAAQTIPSFQLNGYAWSSNIGWISLNCLTGSGTGTSVCGTSNYQVTVLADRTITGYAWSSNIGWIRFGGLSAPFPSGVGTWAGNAQVTGAYPNLTLRGWARSCAATVGGTCASMVSSASSTPFDGWISLGGSTHTVSLDMSSGMNTASYAWGSNVIGWIDMFTRVTFPTITANISGTGCTIASGASTCTGQVTWNITGATSPNVFNLTMSSSFSNAPSGTNQSLTLSEGNNLIQARSASVVLNAVTLVGSCAVSAVWNAGSGICVGAPPVIAISALPNFVRGNRTAVVSWTITPSPLTDGSCTVSGPGISSGVGVPLSTTVTDSRTIANLTAQANYQISCTGSYGTVVETTKIEVIPEPFES